MPDLARISHFAFRLDCGVFLFAKLLELVPSVREHKHEAREIWFSAVSLVKPVLVAEQMIFHAGLSSRKRLRFSHMHHASQTFQKCVARASSSASDLWLVNHFSVIETLVNMESACDEY